MNLEDLLRQTLSRKDPGPEFTDRVLSRAGASRTEWGATHSREGFAWFRFSGLRWAGVAAAAGVLVIGTAQYERHERMARGEAAKEQLMTALRIAGSKLYLAQEKVHQIGQQQ
jgi:hypothetical protein